MEKVIITKVFLSDKDKNKNPFKTKAGKPFWKVGVKFSTHGEDWYSKLCFNENDAEMQLKEGDEVTVVLDENNGYKNFKLPDKQDMLESRLQAYEDTLKKVLAWIKAHDTAENDIKTIGRPYPKADASNTPNFDKPKVEVDEPEEDEINAEDIPF